MLVAPMWSRYARLLESRPLTTKVVTSAAVTGTGDLSCQLVLEGAEVADDIGTPINLITLSA